MAELISLPLCVDEGNGEMCTCLSKRVCSLDGGADLNDPLLPEEALTTVIRVLLSFSLSGHVR